MPAIVAAVGSPPNILAQWLTEEFENLPNVRSSFCVKNLLKFTDGMYLYKLMEFWFVWFPIF